MLPELKSASRPWQALKALKLSSYSDVTKNTKTRKNLAVDHVAIKVGDNKNKIYPSEREIAWMPIKRSRSYNSWRLLSSTQRELLSLALSLALSRAFVPFPSIHNTKLEATAFSSVLSSRDFVVARRRQMSNNRRIFGRASPARRGKRSPVKTGYTRDRRSASLSGR